MGDLPLPEKAFVLYILFRVFTVLGFQLFYTFFCFIIGMSGLLICVTFQEANYDFLKISWDRLVVV